MCRRPRANKLIAEYELTEFGNASLLLSFFQRPQGLNLLVSFFTFTIWTIFKLTHVHSLQNMAKSTSYSAYNRPPPCFDPPKTRGLYPSNIYQTSIRDLLEAKFICFFFMSLPHSCPLLPPVPSFSSLIDNRLPVLLSCADTLTV